jgi:hypothetical protein
LSSHRQQKLKILAFVDSSPLKSPTNDIRIFTDLDVIEPYFLLQESLTLSSMAIIDLLYMMLMLMSMPPLSLGDDDGILWVL